MEDKLLKFVREMNELLYEKDSTLFPDASLSYSTDGETSLIEFDRSQLWISNDHSDWTDLVRELHGRVETYTALHKHIVEFFRGKLNKDIEEKYGLGIENPLTPLSERNDPMV